MLTKDQCIEVAEKVWGWEFDATRSNLNILYLCGIQNQVNSWQGFGRTVEAMADDFHFASDTLFVWFERKGRAGYFSAPLFSKTMNMEDFTQATHLAALEAMKNG
jgi:hypothetical protein